MVKSFCKAEDFKSVSQVKDGAYLIRFSKEPIIAEVYEDYQPTGRYEDTGYVSFMEEYINGEVTLEKVIEARKEELSLYDSSEAINSLVVNGKQMWFDKTTRACIAYSMQVEKEQGADMTTLYDNDGVAYKLPIDTALDMFAQLEMYAKACYNKTQEHKAEIDKLTSIESALSYNIKTGYPEKLEFNIPLL